MNLGDYFEQSRVVDSWVYSVNLFVIYVTFDCSVEKIKGVKIKES